MLLTPERSIQIQNRIGAESPVQVLLPVLRHLLGKSNFELFVDSDFVSDG